MPERIQLAKAFGIAQTYIVTNASLLFPETSKKIITAGLDKMKIGFYGTDEETYQSTMKRLDFKVTLQNIKAFQALWRSLPDKTAGDCMNISSLDNFGGGRSYNTVGEKIVSVCFYPWSALSVLWDGRAVTCCVDYNGVQGIGNLTS
ncbi:MAG: hypothetical protein RBT11_06210 [Desulfobacterales bacterium]|nr:hypothetical protein [Desulfobacterales bacterium]